MRSLHCSGVALLPGCPNEKISSRNNGRRHAASELAPILLHRAQCDIKRKLNLIEKEGEAKDSVLLCLNPERCTTGRQRKLENRARSPARISSKSILRRALSLTRAAFCQPARGAEQTVAGSTGLFCRLCERVCHVSNLLQAESRELLSRTARCWILDSIRITHCSSSRAHQRDTHRCLFLS